MGEFILMFLIIFVIVFVVAYFGMKSNSNPNHEEEMCDDKPGFLNAFLLGLLGGSILEDKLDRNREERERRRHDDLFWQEAARGHHGDYYDDEDLLDNDDDFDL